MCGSMNSGVMVDPIQPSLCNTAIARGLHHEGAACVALDRPTPQGWFGPFMRGGCDE